MNKAKSPKQGSSTTWAIVAVLVILVVVGVVFWQQRSNRNANVNRVANANTLNTNNANANDTVNVNTPSANTNASSGLGAVYRNEEHGYELRYPAAWSVQERQVPGDGGEFDQAHWYITIVPENPSQSSIVTQLAIAVYPIADGESVEEAFFRHTSKRIDGLESRQMLVDGAPGTYFVSIPAFEPYNATLVIKGDALFSIQQGQIPDDLYSGIIDVFRFLPQ